jgi:hypothetical protein
MAKQAKAVLQTEELAAVADRVVGYNVQVAVDTEHHLIVAHEVTRILQRSGNPGMCRSRHHSDIAQANDVRREIARPLR